MERYRLKNIIILILLLLNGFLLAALAIRGTEERTARRTQQQELVSLFAADGMTLDPDLIPENVSVSSYTLLRDESLEQKVATFLLGNGAKPDDQGGGIYTYVTRQGTAIFRDTSSFDAALSSPENDAQDLCRRFCQEFSYDAPVFHLDDSGSGTATAVRMWDKTPVFNSTITFTIDKGTVTTVSGSLLPSTYTEDTENQDLLTAFAALTAFQQMRHESSSVVSTITEISLCYELQSTVTTPMVLVPSWYIATDTAAFYVNCISGVVRRA